MTDKMMKVTVFISPDYDHRDPERMTEAVDWCLSNRFRGGIPLAVKTESTEVEDLESSKYNRKATPAEEYEEAFQDMEEKSDDNV